MQPKCVVFALILRFFSSIMVSACFVHRRCIVGCMLTDLQASQRVMPSCSMRCAIVRMIPIFCWIENLLLVFTDAAGGTFDGTPSSLLLLLSSSEEELIVRTRRSKILINMEKQHESSDSAPSLFCTTSHVRHVKRNPVLVHRKKSFYVD